jgi:hypothetical protein
MNRLLIKVSNARRYYRLIHFTENYTFKSFAKFYLIDLIFLSGYVKLSWIDYYPDIVLDIV